MIATVFVVWDRKAARDGTRPRVFCADVSRMLLAIAIAAERGRR